MVMAAFVRTMAVIRRVVGVASSSEANLVARKRAFATALAAQD